jgi:uncharacterized BrkB/YihY/UPF0761 family membrane protein
VFSEALRLVRLAASSWWNDRAMSLGASISFSTVFCLAPISVTAINMAGLISAGKEIGTALVLTVVLLPGPSSEPLATTS